MYASEDLEQGIEILRSGKHLCLYRCPELHVSFHRKLRKKQETLGNKPLPSLLVTQRVYFSRPTWT